jgi:hypothetical protein
MAANDAQQDQLEALLQQINQLNADNQGKAATQFSFKELTAYLNFNKEPCTSLRHPRHHWDSPTSTCQSTLIIVIRYMLLAFCSIISTPLPRSTPRESETSIPTGAATIGHCTILTSVAYIQAQCKCLN